MFTKARWFSLSTLLLPFMDVKDVQQNSDSSDSIISDDRIYRIKFSVPIIQINRNFPVYIRFRIYRINFAVRRHPIYPSSISLMAEISANFFESYIKNGEKP